MEFKGNAPLPMKFYYYHLVLTPPPYCAWSSARRLARISSRVGSPEAIFDLWPDSVVDRSGCGVIAHIGARKRATIPPPRRAYVSGRGCWSRWARLEHGGVKKRRSEKMPKSAKKGTKKKSVPLLHKSMNTMSIFSVFYAHRKATPPAPNQVRNLQNCFPHFHLRFEVSTPHSYSLSHVSLTVL